MANIPLKSIKFPGLEDTYTVPQVDSTNSIAGAAADAAKTGQDITNLKEDLTNALMIDANGYFYIEGGE